MKRSTWTLIIGVPIALGAGWYGYTRYGPAENPDPNHTHADVAVWIHGQQLDFSGEQYMSEAYDPERGQEVRVDPLRKYLHLHDGNGYVIHRHKPGLTFGDFLGSIGFSIAGVSANGDTCWFTMRDDQPFTDCESDALRFFVNGEEISVLSPQDIVEYEFTDGDKLLLSDAQDEVEIRMQLQEMTDDACLYSKTCPWRGDPPTENCIADPTVPCVIPE